MSHHHPPNQQLMSEEEVRQYFIDRGGVVRNDDIVTYFRSYLANPAIRDEARALFKAIVGKLASFRVENGEKLLTLKSQYFYPPTGPMMDGNGNNSAYGGSNYGLPPSGAEVSLPTALGHPPEYYYPQHPPNPGSNSASFKPFPYQNPTPYVSTGGFYNPNSQMNQQPPSQQLQKPSNNYWPQQQPQPLSQSQYGSQYSLSSMSTTSEQNYNASNHKYGPPATNTYNSPPPPTSAVPVDYDYGLPIPPPVVQSQTPNKQGMPPKRLSFSSPSASISSSSSSLGPIGIGSPIGPPPPRGTMIPPPYRPPPPAYTGNNSNNSSPSRPAQLNFRSPVPTVLPLPQENHPTGYNHPPYQRSLSVSGIGSPTSPPVQIPPKTAYSASPSSENNQFFPASALGTTASSPSSVAPAPPVPPRTKRSASFLDRDHRPSRQNQTTMNVTQDQPDIEPNSTSSSSTTNSESEINDKENSIPAANGNGDSNSISASGPEEKVVSVKERMQKFNKIAVDSDYKSPKSSSKNNKDSKSDFNGDYDTSSLSSYGYNFANSEPKAREWFLKAAKCDYAGINKMATENPSLVKRRDMNGYTALHWAAKMGHLELVKLLAGTFKTHVNSKSNGGFTPLHLAAMFNRTEVYDILVKAYNADTNIRDHSGKKPTQHLVRQDTAVSMDTYKKLKDKRRSTEAQHLNHSGGGERSSTRESFLRIGSLNVRVKKTTEAFGNFLGKSNSASSIERMLSSKSKWGSMDSLPDDDKDKEMMPPPSGSSVKSSKRNKSKRSIPLISSPIQLLNSSSSSGGSESAISPRIKIEESEETDRIGERERNGNDSGSDSDSAGFGSEWKSGKS